MEITNKDFLLLCSCEEIGVKKIDWLIDFADQKNISLQECFFANEELIKEQFGNADYLKLVDAVNISKLEEVKQKLAKYDSHYLCVQDAEYPELLRQIYGAPYGLFYRGDVSILTEQTIAVVGTRKPSFYGREMTEYFVSDLAKENFVIVSGLAYGIDTVAHQTTLKNGGKTIAVLACGFDRIYPSDNKVLADKIVETGGCLLSEYFIGTKPDQYRFPARNRIISGISLATLVTQATEKSGSLITANYAIEQDRDLFVVPANLNLLDSKGTNMLIDSYPTSVVISPKRIILTYRECLNSTEKAKKPEQLGLEEAQIIQCLKSGEKNFDDILIQTKLNPKTLNQKLTSLEISGIIKRLSGNYYSISGEIL